MEISVTLGVFAEECNKRIQKHYTIANCCWKNYFLFGFYSTYGALGIRMCETVLSTNFANGFVITSHERISLRPSKKMVSGKVISAECPFHEPRLIELPLSIKMIFLRRYMAATLLQFTLISSVCTLIILSPMARFYINENAWLLFLLLFLLCSTYLSLVHFTKLSMAKMTLMIHVAVEALTLGVLVTYNDLMVVYQAILLATVCFFWLFLYTLQSKLDYGICITIVVYFTNSFCFSTILRTVFGGSPEDQLYWMLISCFIVFYHAFFIMVASTRLTAEDLMCALINAHTLPINTCVYSSPIHKPLK